MFSEHHNEKFGSNNVQNSIHRFKSQPCRFDLTKKSQAELKNLIFAFKSASQIRKVLKKSRHHSRKGRRPFSQMTVGLALLQFEKETSIQTKKICKKIEIDRIKKSSR